MLVGGLFGRDAHRQIALAHVAADRDLALHQAVHPRARLGEQRLKLGHHVGQLAAGRVGFVLPDQPLGRAVEDADPALRIDADDARARARQHRLGETAAAVDLVARAHQVVALGAQFLRHLVEGLAKLGKVALPAAHRHLHIEIAGGDEIGGADQPPDRRDQPVCEIEPDPHRRQEHDQRDDGVHQREGDLHPDAARFQIGEFRDAFLRRLQLLDDARIERARHVEIGVVIAAQLDHRRDGLRFQEHRDLRLVLADTGQRAARRRRRDVADALDFSLLDDGEVAVHDESERQAAQFGLRLQQLAKPFAVGIEQRLGAAEVERHRGDFIADQLAVLVEIDLRDDERILDDALDARREQRREPALERDAGDDRDQHGGNSGDHREQRDDAHMQPGARPPAPARLHDAPDFAPDDRDQQKRRDRIDRQHGDDDLMSRRDRARGRPTPQT